MPANTLSTRDYDGQRTLVIGEVNSGKTRLTENVLAAWTAQGRSREIAVLDLAPQTRQSIGGRLALPRGFEGICQTPPITPPRLMAPTEAEAEMLARANAATIAPLLRDPRLSKGTILIINDATLYLQAGAYDPFRQVIRSAATALINAYYGHSFPDYRLSRRERRLTERLIQDCDRIIRLPAPPASGPFAEGETPCRF
jgi:hypothetical protein